MSGKMNWFQRHLHWALVIAFLLIIPLLYFTSLTENLSAMALAYFIHYIIVTATCSWVLERKGQSQWYLLYLIFFYPFGIIPCVLRTNKRDEISPKPRLRSITSTNLAVSETPDATVCDKEIERRIDKTWKPDVAGILDIVSAVLVYVFSSWVFIVLLMDPSRETLFIGVISVTVATLALIGGILSLKRKRWIVALVCSVAMFAYIVYFFIQTSKSPFELPVVFGW
ncbi:hypothetical protein ACFLWC_02680, partial [Chloroflexota bacterium]